MVAGHGTIEVCGNDLREKPFSLFEEQHRECYSSASICRLDMEKSPRQN